MNIDGIEEAKDSVVPSASWALTPLRATDTCAFPVCGGSGENVNVTVAEPILATIGEA